MKKERLEKLEKLYSAIEFICDNIVYLIIMSAIITALLLSAYFIADFENFAIINTIVVIDISVVICTAVTFIFLAFINIASNKSDEEGDFNHETNNCH